MSVPQWTEAYREMVEELPPVERMLHDVQQGATITMALQWSPERHQQLRQSKSHMRALLLQRHDGDPVDIEGVLLPNHLVELTPLIYAERAGQRPMSQAHRQPSVLVTLDQLREVLEDLQDTVAMSTSFTEEIL